MADKTKKQRALIAIGTVAHNRPFTARDLSEYVGFDASGYVRGWLKRGLLVRVGSDGRMALYYPQHTLWMMVEGAVG